MKKIGPCRILKKFSANSYEHELPMGLGISPIFNVANLYPYQVGDEGATAASGSSMEVNKHRWINNMTMAKDPEVERAKQTP